jgi:TonB-dependent receptor
LGPLPSDRIFDPNNVGRGISLEENTLGSDGYTASRTTWATYVMADVVKLDPFRLIVGERIEVSDLKVDVGNKVDRMLPPPVTTTQHNTDILPSVNAVLAVTEKSNFRAGFSRTIARPHFREVAPAVFLDYVRRRVVGGNENLRRTSIQNFDLRYETFIGPTELIALSTFYKAFSDPIERTITQAGSGTNVGFANIAGAKAYGFELEARSSLRRITPSLEALTLSGNVSVIQSKVDIPGVDRPLQGQSPYVVNFDVGYFIDGTRTQINALYNVFGRRIEEVGTGGNPDTYEEPVHRVDLTVNQRLPGSFSLKASATNLLNQAVRFTQSDVEILAYKPGVGFFATLEWSLREGKDN